MGHSRKHPYLPHGGNWTLTPLPPSDVLIHLLLLETFFSPLRTAEISSVGGGGFFVERPNVVFIKKSVMLCEIMYIFHVIG